MLPFVVPTSGGGIQFEWHTRGIDLEVEVVQPGRIVALFADSRTGEEWEEETKDFSLLREALQKISR